MIITFLLFNNAISTTSDTSVVSTIQRSGDLVAGAHIEFILTRTFSGSAPTGGSYVSWTNATGYALIKEVSLEIENQVIQLKPGLSCMVSSIEDFVASSPKTTLLSHKELEVRHAVLN